MTVHPYSASATEQRTATFRAWLAAQSAKRCRLIQFVGPNHVAKDVPLAESPSEVRHLLQEAFFVDWNVHEDTVYLRVWEFGYDAPPWANVFSETDVG